MSGDEELFRVSDSATGQPRWALAAPDGSRRRSAVSTARLERQEVDRCDVRALTDLLVAELEVGASRQRTPGGVWWLDVHHVPMRRLLTQVVSKLLQLEAHSGYRAAPGVTAPALGEGLVTTRTGSAREYRYYTVTWSGLAYVLGAPLRSSPAYASGLSRHGSPRGVPPDSPADTQVDARADVLALSWSSRHAATLMPVLEQVRRRGRSVALLDLASDLAQRTRPALGTPVVAVPPWMLWLHGGPEGISRCSAERAAEGRTVEVAGHVLHLGRLEHLVALVVGLSAGCTQPSWRATVELEGWIQRQLAAARPQAVVVSGDVSPLGVLAVRAAEQSGIPSFQVQHGAWTTGSLSRPALLARHQVVMGERDAALARTLVEDPKAEVHVLGQPRFDDLARSDRDGQRRYLLDLFAQAGWYAVQRVLVFAGQPVSPTRLQHQLQLLADGVKAAKGRWGLVVAPHPAQDAALVALASAKGGVPTAVTDAEVGAHGCLAGADAVASVSSTCGLEAVLLGTPVLELTLPGAETLDLAQHGAAVACATPQDIAAALFAVERGHGTPEPAACEAVCHWSGTSAADIAELITTRSPPAHPSAQDDHSSLPPPSAEGATSR